MSFMRAKMTVEKVDPFDTGDGVVEEVIMRPVCRSDAYPDDGSDENNTFAKFTPCGELSLTIQNPDLVGKMKVGDTFYLDFIPAD